MGLFNFSRIMSIASAAVVIVISLSVQALAQQKKPVVKSEPVKAHEAAPDENQSDNGGSDLMILGLGGGYFLPLSDSASMLDPNWCVKIFLQKNNLEKTVFGIGFDITYASLPDSQVNGSITYGSLIPYVTIDMISFWGMQTQLKTGAGFSTLISDLEGDKNFSLSLTLSAGAGIYKIFNNNFYIGLETNYYYYFQLTSTMSLGSYLSMGYRM